MELLYSEMNLNLVSNCSLLITLIRAIKMEFFSFIVASITKTKHVFWGIHNIEHGFYCHGHHSFISIEII